MLGLGLGLGFAGKVIWSSVYTAPSLVHVVNRRILWYIGGVRIFLIQIFVFLFLMFSIEYMFISFF
jgi:hypothetical protein